MAFGSSTKPPKPLALDIIRSVLLPQVYIGSADDEPSTTECAMRAAKLLDQQRTALNEHLAMIARASEHLAPLLEGMVDVQIDTSDLDLDELAKLVADDFKTLHAKAIAAEAYRRQANAYKQRLQAENIEARKAHGQAVSEAVALRGELASAKALVDKLEHLLQSARNEAEDLRKHAAHDADTGMDTVPLDALIDAVRAFIPDCSRVTVPGDQRYISVNAFGTTFDIDATEADAVFGHVRALARHIEIPF